VRALRLYAAAVLLPVVLVAGVAWWQGSRPEPQVPRADVTCMDEPDGAGVYCWR